MKGVTTMIQSINVMFEILLREKNDPTAHLPFNYTKKYTNEPKLQIF